jgi:hypothetical protein
MERGRNTREVRLKIKKMARKFFSWREKFYDCYKLRKHRVTVCIACGMKRAERRYRGRERREKESYKRTLFPPLTVSCASHEDHATVKS